MNKQEQEIQSLIGLTPKGKKSKIPAKLDFWQSATGLILALFMIGHMLFVSSILISKDFMYLVTKFFEAEFLFGEPHTEIVFGTITFIIIVFVAHALIALRKFPINYMQFTRYKTHMKMLNHSDTNLWFYQITTGFAMFFLGSVHLFTMLIQPDNIGPYASSDRFISDNMWGIYLFLLFAVEIHGSIGLYRLSIKWGWFDGKDARKTRKKLKIAKYALTIFMLILGLATFYTYVKIGIQHKNKAGERYIPTYSYTIHNTSKVS